MPRLGVVVTDAVLIREVLKDYGSTSLLGEGGVGHLWAQVLGEWVRDSFDGPGHVDLRRRSRDLFTEATAAGVVQPVFGAPVERAVGRLRDGGTVDVAALARELVGRMVVHLLGLRLDGISSDDEDPQPYLQVYAAGERLASLAVGTQASTHLSAQTVDQGQGGRGRAHPRRPAGVPRLAAEHAAGPLPRARSGRARGHRPRHAPARGRHGDRRQRDGARRSRCWPTPARCTTSSPSPTSCPDAVREGLRVSTPAPVIGRNIVRDTRIGRLPVRAGERVVLLTYVADNAVGPFDVRRPYDPSTRQLWFGAGRHLCLGAPVARAEVAHLLSALAGTGRPWRVVRREPARRALIPTYQVLDIALA